MYQPKRRHFSIQSWSSSDRYFQCQLTCGWPVTTYKSRPTPRGFKHPSLYLETYLLWMQLPCVLKLVQFCKKTALFMLHLNPNSRSFLMMCSCTLAELQCRAKYSKNHWPRGKTSAYLEQLPAFLLNTHTDVGINPLLLSTDKTRKIS